MNPSFFAIPDADTRSLAYYPDTMTDARTISKTTLPNPARTIHRPRLLQRIDAATDTRVVLITGQAAQGKSTLAAAIGRQPGTNCTWMHLDSSDADPVNFFRLLAQALKKVVPTLDISTFLNEPALSRRRATDFARIVNLTAVILETVTARTPLCIVIDGLDELSDTAESLLLIEKICKLVFPPSCLVLVSRKALPLKLEILRMRRELLILDNEDLAFSSDEIFRYFSDLHKLRLTPIQVDEIRNIIDGWVGGLVLIQEVLSHVPEDQRIEFIEKKLPIAMQGKPLTYFSESFFSGLDETTQHILIRSAIFDIIDPKLMARYLGPHQGNKVGPILNTMLRRNLFIHGLFDSETGWGYRYHKLFREFLLDKFSTDLDQREQQVLLKKAADIAWDKGDYEDAIRFFLQAKNFEKAAAGIKRIAIGLSSRGRFTDLAKWIDSLPEAMIKEDTWLFFYKTLSQRITGGRRNIPAFSNALDRFKASADRRGQLLTLACLIEAAVFVGHPAAALNRWIEQAWTMLEAESRNHYYPFAKAMLWMQVAFGCISGAGDLQKGLSACRNALLLAGGIRNNNLSVNATIIHIFGLTLSGEFAAAEKVLKRIHHQVTAAYPEYRTLYNIVQTKLAFYKGDLERAQHLLNANKADIDKFGLLFLYPIHVDLCGVLQIHQRNLEALSRTAQHLTDVATLSANPFYSGLALRLRALNAYHQRHFERAYNWAEQAIGAIVLSMGEENIYRYRCQMILGMAAYHLNDLPTARVALEAADNYFGMVSSLLSLVEARLGLCLVASAMGDGMAADSHRNSALSIAAAKGYKAFPILSDRDILAACPPVLQQVESKVTLFALHLIKQSQIRSTALTSAGDLQAKIPRRPKTAAAVSDISQFFLNIRTLGGFEVYRSDGSIITDAQWAGLRQKLLLKAIIVNGCRDIPKDILMDALWPDSSYDAALRCFKVTLHRLRKILGHKTKQHTGTSFILLKDNLVSLDMERCRVDVDEFLAVCDEVRQVRVDGNDRQLLSVCRKAIEIYRGNFLPEERYLGWAEMKRVALKDQYVALLMDMAKILERTGDLSQAAGYYASVIQLDPLIEKAQQQLMQLLLRQGQRSAAIKVYRDFARTLAEELDTVPDPATKRIYDQIITCG